MTTCGPMELTVISSAIALAMVGLSAWGMARRRRADTPVFSPERADDYVHEAPAATRAIVGPGPEKPDVPAFSYLSVALARVSCDDEAATALDHLQALIGHDDGTLVTTNKRIALELGVSEATASRWRRRWETEGSISTRKVHRRLVLSLPALKQVAKVSHFRGAAPSLACTSLNATQNAA